MTNGLLQLGLFLIMFALPCGLFLLSTLVAEELRDFFESSALSALTHLLSTMALAYGIVELSRSVFTSSQFYHFGLIIDIGCALITLAWLLGVNGCLYGDQAPNKRIGARGIKRYR